MRVSRKNRLLWASATAALATGLPTTVAAQSNETATEAHDGPTIVVTARKRAEDLVDVPVPVTVATQEQLDRDQVVTLADLQRITPALVVSQTFGGESNGGAGLRGIRTGVFNPSVSPSVALIVDQSAIGNLAFPVLHDIAQVEVLRGPQGTLFGQGASAGVLNISTVAPSFDGVSISGRLDYADDGTAGSESTEIIARSALNLPLSDTAALRVAGYYKRDEGLQTNRFLDRDNVIQDYAVRGRLRFEPSSSAQIDLIVDYGKSDQDGVTFFTPISIPNNPAEFFPGGPPIGAISFGDLTDPNGCGLIPEDFEGRARFYCSDLTPTQNLEVFTFTGVVELDLTDSLSVTSITSYRERDLGNVRRNFSGRVLGPAARDENILDETEQFSQEIRFTYEGTGFDVIFGGFFNDYDFRKRPLDASLPFGSTPVGTRSGFSVCSNDGGFCPVPVQFPSETSANQTFALFADATVELSPELSLFGGLRWTDYENSTTISIDEGAAFPRAAELDESDLSGRIGISYQPNPDTNIYASYSRGYKPGAIAAGALPTDDLIILENEKSSAFELGTRLAFGEFQFAGNIFYMEVDNYQGQESIFIPGNAELFSRVRSLGTIETYGIELSLFGQVTDNLSLNAGYTWNPATYPGDFFGDDGQDLEGEQVLLAPKHKITLSGEYSQPIGDSLEAFVGGNLIYQSRIRLSNRTEVPGSNQIFSNPAGETVNLRLGIRDADGRWNASLFARNLTKTRQYASVLPISFAGNDDFGVRAFPVTGLTTRVVGLTLGFNY